MTIEELQKQKADIERQIAAQQRPNEDSRVFRSYKDTRSAQQVQASIKDLKGTVAELEREMKRNILLREPNRNDALYTQLENWQQMLDKDYQRLAVIEAEEQQEIQKRIAIAKGQGLFNIRVLPNGQVVGDQTQSIPLNYQDITL